MRLSVGLICLAIFAATAFAAGHLNAGGSKEDVSKESIVCQCRCCYLGDCRPLDNATWFVDDCKQCTTQLCQNHIRERGVKRRTAMVFEALNGDLPEEAVVAEEVDVCEIISVLEAATCPESKSRQCRRSTDLAAECYDRNDWLRMLIVVCFLGMSGAGIVIGLTKSYLPGMRKYNKKWFNY